MNISWSLLANELCCFRTGGESDFANLCWCKYLFVYNQKAFTRDNLIANIETEFPLHLQLISSQKNQTQIKNFSKPFLSEILEYFKENIYLCSTPRAHSKQFSMIFWCMLKWEIFVLKVTFIRSWNLWIQISHQTLIFELGNLNLCLSEFSKPPLTKLLLCLYKL